MKARLAWHRNKLVAVWYEKDGVRRRASLGTTDVETARKRLIKFRARAGVALERGYIYFIRCNNADGFIKIGFATNTGLRLSALGVGAPYPLELLAVMPGSREDEAALHERFSSDHVRGEWFQPTATLLEIIARAKKDTALPDMDIGIPCVLECTKDARMANETGFEPKDSP